jgi:hypothetical protein
MTADSKAQELEADDRATTWMKGGHAAELERRFRVRPSPSEMELERRALVILVGVIRWRSLKLDLTARTRRVPTRSRG